MSQLRNKKIIKVAVGIIGCLLLAVLFFEISGFLFLKIFRLPLEICRPWTIFQYWMMYRDSNRSFIKAAILGCLLAPWLITAAVAIAIKIKAGKRSLHATRRFKNTGLSIRRTDWIKPSWLANITEDTLITAEQSLFF